MSKKDTFSRLVRMLSFETAILIFLAVAFLVIQAGSNYKERQVWIHHTYSVIGELQSLNVALSQAETSQRGYFISKDSLYLNAFEDSLLDIRALLSNLLLLTEDNIEQNSQIQDLKQNIEKRISMYNEIIDLRRNDKIQKAQKIISQPERRDFSKSIKKDLDGIIKDETDLLNKRLEYSSHIEKRFKWLMALGGILCLLLIFTSRYLMKRDNKRLIFSLEEQEKQKQLLDSIISSMGEGLVVTDKQGHYIHVNQAAEKVLGEKSKILKTQDITLDFGFYNPETLRKIDVSELPSRRGLQGLSTDNFEILIKNETHPKGVVISTNGRPILNMDGEVVGAISVFRDVSQQKEIEKQRIIARELAIEALRKKSDFLATMSHEIRTPMNGILGMSTLLLGTQLSQEQKDFVTVINKSADSLLGLINGILDHSKIEAGKLTLNEFDFDLKVLVEGVKSAFTYSVQEKSIDFKVDSNVPKNLMFRGDLDRIRQVLMNLIGNAIKFTDHGFVHLNVKVKDENETYSRVRFEIQDTGPGLSTSEIEQIFEKYIQTKIGQMKGGSGLGLMISKQLVELMSGRIGVESKVGVGSLFWFEIPLYKSSIQNDFCLLNSNVIPKLQGHVLIAEDQPINALVISKFLDNLGITYEIVTNGEEAFKKYKESEYDLIFMDCRMPVMNGYDSTIAIRNYQKLNNRECAILALTAEGTSGDRSKCLEVGMNEVLSKPIELPKLISTLLKYLKPNTTSLDMEYLNKIKKYSSSDKDLSTLLVQEFLDSSPLLIETIKQSIDQNELEPMSDAAHALKSASSTIGAKKLAQMCETFEKSKVLPKADEFLVLKHEWKAVIGLLEEELRRLSRKPA